MNSREWREARERKLSENPLCENCLKNGLEVEATCVHHIREVESGRTEEECKYLCYGNSGNLLSLCNKCHHKLHNGKGYHTKEAVIQRREERLARWLNTISGRFVNTEK